MNDPFDDPGPLDSIKWADYEHRLVLVTPHRIEHNVPNLDNTGTRDVTFADVVVLDGPGAPLLFRHTPVFPAYIQGQLRGNVGTGRSCLGRIGKDTARQQRGQSAPWVLGTPSDADKALARDHLARAPHTNPPASSPSTSAAAVAEPPF
jgi:hypothetical protein